MNNFLWEPVTAVKKLSFPSGRVPVAGEELRKFIGEVKQGSNHIEMALCLTECASQDMVCVNSISKAQKLLLELLRMVSTSVSNDPQDRYGDETVNGWNPMKSEFVDITGLHKKSKELRWGPNGNLKRSKVVCKAVTPHRKPSSNAMTFECLICDVYCNSNQQLKEHINGNPHREMLAVVDPVQRMKSISRAQFECNKWKKTMAKYEFYEMDDDNVKFTKNGEFGLRSKWKRTSRKYEKPRFVGKRYDQEIPVRCELCNIICSGKFQFKEHINGKRHKIAVRKVTNSL